MFKKKTIELERQIETMRDINIKTLNCPCCGQVIITGKVEDIETLIEWKNQK